MDFLVVVGDKSLVTSQFNEAYDFIQTHLASWNNFTPESPIKIEVRKIPSETPTINVSVDEKVNIEDVFGRP